MNGKKLVKYNEFVVIIAVGIQIQTIPKSEQRFKEQEDFNSQLRSE